MNTLIKFSNEVRCVDHLPVSEEEKAQGIENFANTYTDLIIKEDLSSFITYLRDELEYSNEQIERLTSAGTSFIYRS